MLSVQLLKKSIWSLTLLFGLITGSFLLFNVIPNDPARIMLGPNASEEAVELLRRDLELDHPLSDQWFKHIKKLANFDLGRSIIDGKRVDKEIIDKFLITAQIGGLAVCLALLISYLINFIVFIYPSLRILIKLTSLGVVVPTFFSGIITALFLGVWMPIISLTGYGSKNNSTYILPSIIAALYPTALMTKVLFEKITSAATSDYSKAARSFGFSKPHIFHRVLLRPVAVPWLATWLNQISIVFVASFIIEVIFTIPGVGSLLLTTIQNRDFPILQGIVLVNAIFFITLFWLGDIIFTFIDPRLRLNAEE